MPWPLWGLAQVADPEAPWAIVIAAAGLVISAVVGVYTAWSNRRASREAAEVANWPALVRALQDEVARLHVAHTGDVERYRAEQAELIGRVVLLERAVQSLTAPAPVPDKEIDS